MAAKKKAPARKAATAKNKAKAPTPIGAIVHEESRVNIPTADAQDLVTDEVQHITQLKYPRNPDLDPQLVWKGKDAQDETDLFVDVPPIFIQEKIDPRVLVENLRSTAAKPEDEPELRLFDDFDGLDEMQSVEFYQHASNWANRMILGDSLQTMASLAERESLRGKVQMIYMDPPYGIKFGSNWQVSMRNRTVGDKKEDIAREVEVVKAFRDTWELGIHSYLTYLRDRLIVIRDLLTESGSFFLQIGDENLHLARSILDEIFGANNFAGLITYQKTSSANATAGLKSIGAVADYIVWYARDLEKAKYRPLYIEKKFGAPGASGYTSVELADGVRRPLTAEEKMDTANLPPGARIFARDNMTSQTGSEVGKFPIEINGRTYRPKNGVWKTNQQGVSRLLLANRIIAGKTSLSYLRYLDDFAAYGLNNVWSDATGGTIADKIYVVQTSTKVVERCMLMCTDPGDLVLDPTCGSGTTAFVAEHFGRRWITIDSSRVALAIAKQRLMGAKFPYFLLADSDEGRQKEQSLTGKPVVGGPCRNDIRQGFVHHRVPHVTLGSIAQNPDIKEGMTKKQIDEVIARNAEMEMLWDKPYEDNSRVRVSGRFTVESLSPHRSLGFVQYLEDESGDAAEAADDFNEMILANLARSGIQNGLKKQRLKFESVESHGGLYIQAVAVQESGDDTAGRKVAIAVGPQYGTVSPAFIKDATREAQKIDDVKMLCILGFAFDPTAAADAGEYQVVDDALGAVARETTLGKLAVVLVRMNTDLLMGDELKKTGAGNLFVVSGEPDIKINKKSGRVSVEIRGVDVYDPNTDQVRSRSTDEIALWMIDTNYNGESFFVRQCYFPGGQDPYKSLKRALKAEIDEETWESLNSVVSHDFPVPETGKIAVKVINDYGDEVMKVFEVA